MEKSNSKDTLLLRINNHDYFFNHLTDYVVQPCYKTHLSFFEKSIRKMTAFVKVPCGICYGSWKRRLNRIKRVILFDYGYEKNITKYIKRINPECIIHLFLFNTIKMDFLNTIKSDSNIDYIWTFDPADAQKYGFRFNTPMYTYNLYSDYENKNKCVIFVGAAKSRESDIKQIQLEISKAGVKTDFRIVKDKSDYIKYEDYLTLIREGNCILDVTNEGQTGLTLRFMEALFLSKKLITNNKQVLSYPFYNKNNIFIIGTDPLEELGDFLAREYQPIEKEIILYYDFNRWVERFLEVEDVKNTKEQII